MSALNPPRCNSPTTPYYIADSVLPSWTCSNGCPAKYPYSPQFLNNWCYAQCPPNSQTDEIHHKCTPCPSGYVSFQGQACQKSCDANGLIKNCVCTYTNVNGKCIPKYAYVGGQCKMSKGGKYSDVDTCRAEHKTYTQPCPSDAPYRDRRGQCTNNCGTDVLSTDNKTCIQNCDSIGAYKMENEGRCLETCPDNLPLRHDEHLCSSCPKGTISAGQTGGCYNEQCRNKFVDASGNCDNTWKDGMCFLGSASPFYLAGLGDNAKNQDVIANDSQCCGGTRGNCMPDFGCGCVNKQFPLA